MELPMINTPRILERKKARIRKIWIWTAILCAVLFAAFFVSIHMTPPAPFLFSICCVGIPFLILFAAAMLHAHAKYFPEFDYGRLTPEQIRTLPVSDQFLKERNRLRKRKAFHFLLLVMFTIISVTSITIDSSDMQGFFYGLRYGLYVMDFVAAIGLMLTTTALTRDVALRRRLEYIKYTVT